MPETLDLLPTPGHLLRTTGRQALPLELDFARVLTEADVARAGEPRGSKPPTLKALKDTHHSIAKMLASGKRPAEVSAIMGYSLSRISILQGDPAFKELLEFYRDNAQAAYRDLHEQLASISSTALNVMVERLEDTPEAVSDDTLLDLVKLGADRTGHGPQSKNVNLNVNVDLASRLERGRARVAELRQSGEGPREILHAKALPAPAGASHPPSTED